MHSFEEMGSNVPAFLGKLWRMVEDPETNDLIKWSPSGTSFIIRCQARFSLELLPVYYKHNNMASFVRQLNMYGFHKVVSIEGGGLKIDKDEMEFAHSCFLKGNPFLLGHIKRKISTKLEESQASPKPEIVNKVLSEVKSMKGRQDSLDSQLSALKRENEVLWREVAILRQKHIKQQQIVNKLIQFLISLVHSRNSSGIGIKRHLPLMLHDKEHRDTAHHPSSSNKPKPNTHTEESHELDVPNLSPTGPVIHELEASDLPEESINSTEETPGSDFLNVDFSQGEVHSPSSSTGKSSACASLTEPNCDVLLDLVEEYPLSPELMKTVAPADVNPCITSSIDKSTSAATKNKAKKRKTKPVKIKEEVVEPQEVDSLNVGDFLEIVLPNLDSTVGDALDPTVGASLEPTVGTSMNPTIESSLDSTVDSMIQLDPNDLTSLELNTGSLEAANKAAISAISSVAENSNSAKDETVVDYNPNNLSLACAPSVSPVSSIKRYNIFKEDLDSHLGSTQSDLDSLKDLLKGEGYNLDANTLLGVRPALLGVEKDAFLKMTTSLRSEDFLLPPLQLFSEDPVMYGLHIMEENENQNKENNSTDPMVSGSELATYSSNLLDLVDLNSGLDDWPLPEDNLVENYNSEVNTPQVMLLDAPDFSNPPAKKRKK